MNRLFKRIKHLTRNHGEKAALAKLLGVLPSTLGDWMSQRFEPGGEFTLHLLDWATAAEAKQKKHAGSARTLPALKAQKKKSTSNEKPNSGPKTG